MPHKRTRMFNQLELAALHARIERVLAIEDKVYLSTYLAEYPELVASVAKTIDVLQEIVAMHDAQATPPLLVQYALEHPKPEPATLPVISGSISEPPTCCSDDSLEETTYDWTNATPDLREPVFQRTNSDEDFGCQTSDSDQDDTDTYNKKLSCCIV